MTWQLDLNTTDILYNWFSIEGPIIFCLGGIVVIFIIALILPNKENREK